MDKTEKEKIEPVVFVPGGLMPAALHYEPLLDVLKDEVEPLLKDFELYAGDDVPAHYSLDTEVEGVRAAADAAGFGSFHIIGYSTCVPVAFVSHYPERVRTLTMVEPGLIGRGTFAPADMVAAHHERMRLPPDEMFAAMTRSMLAPGVDRPPPPSGPPPPWMQERLRRGGKLMSASLAYELDEESLSRFQGPAWVVVGSLGHPSLISLARALAESFPRGRVKVWDGSFHLDPAHRSDPRNFASALKRFWASVER